jgi:hypothetical protein
LLNRLRVTGIKILLKEAKHGYKYIQFIAFFLASEGFQTRMQSEFTKWNSIGTFRDVKFLGCFED